MDYLIGRNNLAATIYVPYDCKNNCPFCTSKKEYSRLKMDENAVKQALRKLVAHPDIKDIVFTGGEPTANPKLLKELVEIARHKNVYINTTLPRNNFFECLDIFNGGVVSGVNVSRHHATFAQDSKVFHDVVDDWTLGGIGVPVKVNVVLTDKTTIDEVKDIIQRWKPYKKVTVCFRRDFRKTTFSTLHLLAGDPILDYLTDNYTLAAHTFCDVCDTVLFEERISFHRGLEESSFELGGKVIVNDIIVFPNGEISYDWDKKPIQYLTGFMDRGVPPSKRIRATKQTNTTPVNSPVYQPYVGSCGAGSSGCGASSFGFGCGFSHC